MADFYLSEILLVSQTERRGRKVQFDPNMTVVQGRNRTGKSVLLKSIYWTFGAEPAVIHSRWKKAQVAALVRFRIGEERYQLLRRGRMFSLFSHDGKSLQTFTRVSGGIGPALADLMGFGLRLPNREGEIAIPPPAFQFLPYYVDQDRGWIQNWSSFASLGQIPKWKKPTVEFHAGIRGNEYYEVTSRLHTVRAAAAELAAHLTILQSVVREVRTELDAGGFDTDIEAFRLEIQDLLLECNRLVQLENRLKAQLEELHNRRAVLQTQIKIVEQALAEVQRDLRFATFEIETSAVSCPTCGAEYKNSFAERFGIAEDEDRLTDFAAELTGALAEVDDEIAAVNARFSNQHEEVQRVRRLLDAREGEISLEAVLQAQGRRAVSDTFREKVQSAYEMIGQREAERKLLEARQAALTRDARDRRERILSMYQRLMLQFTRRLNVDIRESRAYQQPDVTIMETGSELPRALLAYYFTMFHVMREHSPSSFCPIVIDSPNQQGQDPSNLATLLTFIRDNRPEGSQTILGLEDSHGVEFPGKTVSLGDEGYLLQPGEFEEVAAEVMPLLRLGGEWDLFSGE